MRTYKLKIEDKAVTVEVKTFSSAGADLVVNGTAMHVDVDSIESKAGKPAARKAAAPSAAAPVAAATPTAQAGDVTAPIPGAIKEVFVQEGDSVKAGQAVLIMEAMKMENQVQSAAEGVVREVKVQPGDSVSQGQVLIVID